jgi:eIF-2B alpha/beta/delta-like uncharacterized protein
MNNSQAPLHTIVTQLAKMQIQGADRILRAAMSAILHFCRDTEWRNIDAFSKNLTELCCQIQKSRPTCASLLNGISYIRQAIPPSTPETSLRELKGIVEERATRVIQYSLWAKKAITRHTYKVCRNVERIVTLCSSQTVIDSIIHLHKSSSSLREVIVLETRPRFQGWKTARLLAREKIRVTLTIDSMASARISNADAILIGADAIFRTGDILNKVGSHQLALLASIYDKKVYVLTAKHKYINASSGEHGIEQRPPTEIVPQADLAAMKGVSVQNPAYDLVSAELIKAIICEEGVFQPAFLPRHVGWQIPPGEEKQRNC